MAAATVPSCQTNHQIRNRKRTQRNERNLRRSQRNLRLLRKDSRRHLRFPYLPSVHEPNATEVRESVLAKSHVDCDYSDMPPLCYHPGTKPPSKLPPHQPFKTFTASQIANLMNKKIIESKEDMPKGAENTIRSWMSTGSTLTDYLLFQQTKISNRLPNNGAATPVELSSISMSLMIICVPPI